MSIIDNAKEIADLIKKMGDIELYRKIVSLEGEVIDLTREKRELEEKCSGLQRAINLKRLLTFKEPFYFEGNDNTPYCAPCWELKHDAVHVVKVWAEGGETRWDCPVCKNACKVHNNNPAFRNY